MMKYIKSVLTQTSPEGWLLIAFGWVMLALDARVADPQARMIWHWLLPVLVILLGVKWVRNFQAGKGVKDFCLYLWHSRTLHISCGISVWPGFFLFFLPVLDPLAYAVAMTMTGFSFLMFLISLSRLLYRRHAAVSIPGSSPR